MKFFSLIGSSDRKKGSVLFDREGQEIKKRLIVKTNKDIYRIEKKKQRESSYSKRLVIVNQFCASI